MKRILFAALGLLFIFNPVANAGLIAGDLLSSGSLNRISYDNVWQDGFHSSSDVFQTISGADVSQFPSVFIDDSLQNQSDNLGILIADQIDAQTSIFAVSDTKNSDTQDKVEANWLFDISSGTNNQFSIELAAMGDFEVSDWFTLDLSIAALGWRQLFEFKVEEAAAQSYVLASGKQVTLSDPLSFEGTTLSNQFQRFSWQIPQAERLSVKFSAKADGGSEALAMRNMIVSGQVTSVPEPSSIVLLILGWTYLIRRAVIN